MKKVFKVKGLDCLSCKLKFDEVVANFVGVKAEVDFESSVAKVEFLNPDLKADFLLNAKKAGFEVEEI